MSDTFTNTIGMTFVRIPAGSLLMGDDDGDFDEKPAHRVTIGGAFHMAVTPVTNARYEQFAPGHRALRGERGFSGGDDEAVVFVNWHEAVAFCEWLSTKEGRRYRLPTEAEWEYACRAGTSTAYHTGDELPAEYHRHQQADWDPTPVDLTVGRSAPNAFGPRDMHGPVEQWCADWYGPYEPGEQTDPVGRAGGEMKVTRGGSHNADVEYLRSAGRLGTLPADKHWLIGFRVVCGDAPSTPLLAPPEPPLWARGVGREPHDWSGGPDADVPYFADPRVFVRIPAGANGPLYSRHNHCPSIAWCANGDLLAAWFSTNTEKGREMAIAAARLRRGATEWDDADVFFKAPARNMTGTALFHDGEGGLLHFNGLEASGHWANLALVLRTSTDNGATWTTRLINPVHQPRNQVISGTLRTREGWLVQPCDAVHSGSGGTAIHVSKDGGRTWVDPGGTIAGIHAGVVQLADGSLLALGRGDNRLGSDDNIGERMPMSRSSDVGRSWTCSASCFNPISSGQRLVLLRLREGPILFASFTDRTQDLGDPRGMEVVDAAGVKRTVFGLFAALSFDEGQTWPVRRPITDDGAGRTFDGGAWTRDFVMDAEHAEPRGYLAATQTPDGVIHLISSALHYCLNLAWLRAPMPAAERAPEA